MGGRGGAARRAPPSPPAQPPVSCVLRVQTGTATLTVSLLSANDAIVFATQFTGLALGVKEKVLAALTGVYGKLEALKAGLSGPARHTASQQLRPLMAALDAAGREALRNELSGLEDRVSLVIADNASTDGTAELIANFAGNFPRVRVVTQATNLGMDANFRACASAVDGDFFWVMGDDDLPVQGAIGPA